jgi:predicted  nucleic acid-binding Zn-ribbon protein
MYPIICKSCGNKIVTTVEGETISINEKEFCEHCSSILELLRNNFRKENKRNK